MRRLLLFFCLVSLTGCSTTQMQNLSALIEEFNQGQQTYYPTTTYTPKTYGNSYTRNYQASNIYSSSECAGAVVNGRCSGTMNTDPSNVLRKKCYGAMINGVCQGAIGY